MTDLNHAYACPECVNTGWVGPFRLSSTRTRGSGRTWYPYSGAVAYGMTATEPQGHWGDCWRCKGTGLVDDRRRPNALGGSGRRIGVPDRRIAGNEV